MGAADGAAPPVKETTCDPATRKALLITLLRDERVRELVSLGWAPHEIGEILTREGWPPTPFHHMIYSPVKTRFR